MRKYLLLILVAIGATVLMSSFTASTTSETKTEMSAKKAGSHKFSKMMMVYAYSKCYEHSGSTYSQLKAQNENYVQSHSWGIVLYSEINSEQSIAGYPTHAWRTCVTTYYYWFQPV